MSGFLQDALMTDAKSRFEVMEDRIVQGSLDFAKRRVISNVREHLRTEIFAWVQSHYGAGSLARAKRLKNPFCVLASMHGEISFTHAPRYMRLLDINPVSIAFESDSDPGFYFVYPRTFNTPLRCGRSLLITKHRCCRSKGPREYPVQVPRTGRANHNGRGGSSRS